LSLISVAAPLLSLERRLLANQTTGRGWSNWTASLAYSKASPASLREVANGRTAGRKFRAKAVFSLFATYIRPAVGSEAVGNVLSPLSWLAESRLEGVYALGGWIPVEQGLTDTAFSVRLFPDPNGTSPWIMYFTLSGARGRSESDAREFIAGKMANRGEVTLVEYALCWLGEGQRSGRIERFSSKGMRALDPW
jgi:hypothetical protein